MKTPRKPSKAQEPDPKTAASVRPRADVGTMAKLFHMTPIRVQQLAKMGVVVKVERGQYDLWASIDGYIKYLQECVSKRSGGDEGDELRKHKTRREAANAEMAEIELELMRGDSHKSDLVREFVGAMIVTAKTKLRSVPNKGAAQTEGLTLVEREAVLSVLIEEALRALAQFNPSEITTKYIAQHRTLSGVDAAVGAAAEADAEPVG